MNRRTFLKAAPAVTVLAATASGLAEVAGTAPAAAPATAPAADLQPITLLKPEKDGGKTVLAALWERKTNRNISPEKLPPQMLSNLLWAAFGVNRPEGADGWGKRTAASASNSQEIDLYVFLPEGVYLYEAGSHRLAPVLAGDLRGKISDHGRGGAAAKAPVNIIYVVDIAKFTKARFQEPGLKDQDIQKSYYGIDAGLIAGNVYLFAASQGLAAWFHNCDKPGLAAELKLRPDQRVMFVHTVGLPAQGQPSR